ncbi:hypothetical protein [Virgisporangium aurantiacum]|uniref:Uncharacterized protein n=1 Tax=Virgisporangium aurantiacum TaxID=175570 RepID=A0A8J4E2P0_9ACTN|nr:hypothetical protein [Virgisporangium aurantiacum]GIJ59083.1 hypothetical protein Vau01_065990 [Virgisporangium aurantiacum]
MNVDRRPARPIPYGIAARAVDWWDARSDARAGLPALDGGQAARRFTYTPTLERLRHRAADAIEHELLRLERERAAPARALAAVREQVPMAETVVAKARSALSAASRPLDETDLRERRAGETRTDAAVVRKRRQLTHDKRVADREAALDAAERDLLRLRSTEADLVESIRRSELVAAARARRIHEHTWRRISAYWQHLVRRHPDGAALNAVLGIAEPDLPGWARYDLTEA